MSKIAKVKEVVRVPSRPSRVSKRVHSECKLLALPPSPVPWLNHPVVEPLIVVKLVKQLVCFKDKQQTVSGPENVPLKLTVIDFTARFLTIRDA